MNNEREMWVPASYPVAAFEPHPPQDRDSPERTAAHNGGEEPTIKRVPQEKAEEVVIDPRYPQGPIHPSTSNNTVPLPYGFFCSGDPSPHVYIVESLNVSEVKTLCEAIEKKTPKNEFVVLMESFDLLKNCNVPREGVDTTEILSQLITLQDHPNNIVSAKAKEVHARLQNIPVFAAKFPAWMKQTTGLPSHAQKLASLPSSSSTALSPEQQSTPSVATKTPSTFPFNFGSSFPSNSASKEFAPVLRKNDQVNESLPSPMGLGLQVPMATPKHEASPFTPKLVAPASSTSIPRLRTSADLLTWVRTFLDIDAVSLRPLYAELQSLHKGILEFENALLEQAEAESKRAAAIQVKADDILATEKIVVEMRSFFTSASKVARLQHLQSEIPRMERELRQVQAATAALRDAFIKIILTPLRTLFCVNAAEWQAKETSMQTMQDVLQSRVSKLSEIVRRMTLDRYTHNGTVERLQKALDERTAKMEEAEKQLAASGATEEQLQKTISTAEKKHNDALVAHTFELSEVTARKMQLEIDLAAKMTESSLQEGTIQTKYREKMNEKLAALNKGKEKALLSQKQKYEAQIEGAQALAVQLAKAHTKTSKLELRITEIEKQHFDTNMAKATLENQLADLKSRGKQMQSFEDAYEQVKQELDELQNTYNDVLYERDELKERVDALQAAHEDSALDINVTPDARHIDDKGVHEKEHTRSIAAHWENKLKARLNVVDKKTADLAACNAEIEQLQAAMRGEASSSRGPLRRRTAIPAGGQLLDVGVVGLDAPKVGTGEDAPTDLAPDGHTPDAGSSGIQAGPSSRKERGVRMGRPVLGEVAWQEVPTVRNVGGKGIGKKP